MHVLRSKEESLCYKCSSFKDIVKDQCLTLLYEGCAFNVQFYCLRSLSIESGVLVEIFEAKDLQNVCEKFPGAWESLLAELMYNVTL